MVEATTWGLNVIKKPEVALTKLQRWQMEVWEKFSVCPGDFITEHNTEALTSSAHAHHVTFTTWLMSKRLYRRMHRTTIYNSDHICLGGRIKKRQPDTSAHQKTWDGWTSVQAIERWRKELRVERKYRGWLSLCWDYKHNLFCWMRPLCVHAQADYPVQLFTISNSSRCHDACSGTQADKTVVFWRFPWKLH